MAKDQKIIRAKAGLLEAAKAAWRHRPGLQDHGLLSLRQLLPVQGPLRQRRGAGASGDVAPQADPEEPGAALRSRRRWRPWRSTSRPHGQTRVSNELAQQGMAVSPFGVRSVWLRHDLKDHQAPAQGSRGEDGRGTA